MNEPIIVDTEPIIVDGCRCSPDLVFVVAAIHALGRRIIITDGRLEIIATDVRGAFDVETELRTLIEMVRADDSSEWVTTNG